MKHGLIVAIFALGTLSPGAAQFARGQASSLSEPSLSAPSFNASIKALQQYDLQIPAEEAGVLKLLPVREGTQVGAGELLAQIDERLARAQVEIARLGYEAAVKRASDDIEERYAKKAAAVAWVDWIRDKEANQSKANAIPDIQIRQKKLVVDRSELQIEKAQKDQELAATDAEVKLAEQSAAQIGVDRRTIVAPFDGEVQTLFRQQSEWVNPGDPIMRFIRFDLLSAECYVSAADYDPAEIFGAEASLQVTLARGRTETVSGKVVYVSQMVQGDGKYLVRAEVQNQRQGPFWLVRPGLTGTLTLHLDRKPTTPAVRNRATSGVPAAVADRTGSVLPSAGGSN